MTPVLTATRRQMFVALTSAIVLFSFLHPAARAFGIYPPGSTGIDISWPQCEKGMPSSPQSFGIIGVTGGRAFYQNPCLVSEYSWSLLGSAPPSFFINLNSPMGSAAFKADTGPRGFCRPDDAICRSYNFGFNAARLAYADAQSQETTSSMWWLDVETENSWSDNTAANGQVVQGAIDYIRTQGRSVGLYSTGMQWAQIAGSFNPGLPNWVAGAPDAATAQSYCASSYAFGGGTVWLVQYVSGDFDTNYACPAQAPGPPALTPPTLTPPLTPAPPAPTGLQGVAINATSAALQWTAPPGIVNNYLVSDGGTQIGNPSGGTTSFTAQGLAPGSYHCFAVSAMNAGGFSPWTAWACVTTPSS
jgi:hypothetical protein